MRRDPGSNTAGVFYRNSRIGFRDMIDGSSNALVVGERAWRHGNNIAANSGVCFGIGDQNGGSQGNAVIQGGTDRADELVNIANYDHGLAFALGGASARLNEKGSIGRLGFSSPHVGGVHFLLGDGSVRFLSENLDHRPDTVAIDSLFEYLCAYGDGNPVGEF
jgi:hypothetical protein